MANAVILPGERLAGLSADLFHKLQAGSLTLDELALFTQRKNPFEIAAVNSDVSGVFRLTVDCGKSLEQMIAAGHYDWKNSDITPKRFPIKGNGVVECEARYFHFNRNIFSEKAIEAMKEAGWESAQIEHVLSLGATFPEEQRKFPIIGLGSVALVGGDRRVPCLSGDGSGRSLGLYWFVHVWGAYFRFLAVRKVSAA